MLITTTNQVDGHRIKQYLGLVTGEIILSQNIFQDFFAGFRDMIPGTMSGFEQELEKARKQAFAKLRDVAEKLTANAIVGVNLKYESIAQGMLLVSVIGTAVILKYTNETN